MILCPVIGLILFILSFMPLMVFLKRFLKRGNENRLKETVSSKMKIPLKNEFLPINMKVWKADPLFFNHSD